MVELVEVGGDTGDCALTRGEEVGEVKIEALEEEMGEGVLLIMREREGSSRVKGKEGRRRKREVAGTGEECERE